MEHRAANITSAHSRHLLLLLSLVLLLLHNGTRMSAYGTWQPPFGKVAVYRHLDSVQTSLK